MMCVCLKYDEFNIYFNFNVVRSWNIIISNYISVLYSFAGLLGLGIDSNAVCNENGMMGRVYST